MKKFLLAVITATAFCLVLFFLQSCIKDTYTRTYTYSYYQPVFKTRQEVRANIKSNAAEPIERPGKIYIKGQYIFLNEIDKGIHVIDNSNPASPQRIAFITIPGNLDIAVKGNTLYADLYTDLVAIDISNPHNVVLKKTVEGIFPYRYYGVQSDSSKMIARWEKRDTTVKQTFDIGGWARERNVFLQLAANSGSGGGRGGVVASVAPYGMGGSMARFAITGDRLYTAGNQNLDVFNISDAVDPVSVARKNLGWNIETIYPFRDKLFIGSQTGMFIYNISNPDNPVQSGQFSHARVCDPVIADQNYAYVTLRSGNNCVGFTNQLDIVSVQTSNPTLIKTYSMTNPYGLSKDGNTLFICDGRDGLKVYDASNVSSLQLIKQIQGIETYDVIAFNNYALVVAKDGIYQYDYSDLNNITLKSKMTVSR